MKTLKNTKTPPEVTPEERLVEALTRAVVAFLEDGCWLNAHLTNKQKRAVRQGQKLLEDLLSEGMN